MLHKKAALAAFFTSVLPVLVLTGEQINRLMRDIYCIYQGPMSAQDVFDRELKTGVFTLYAFHFIIYIFISVNVLKFHKYSMLLAKNIATILACACFYYVAFSFNRFIFNEYSFSFGVNWIFIPSGLQLVLVLTAVEEAALGIAIASWLIGFQYYYLDSDLNTIITGIITGASPLLARKISFDFLHIEDDLKNLTFKSIMLMSVIFALLSATLHQLWFFYNHVSDQFINNLLVMIIGNLTGTFIVLVFIKAAAGLLKRNNSPIE